MSPSDLTERELKLLCYALYRMASSARNNAMDAAQDIDRQFFRRGATEDFLRDADDAEALLTRLRAEVSSRDDKAQA